MKSVTFIAIWFVVFIIFFSSAKEWKESRDHRVVEQAIIRHLQETKKRKFVWVDKDSAKLGTHTAQLDTENS